MFYHVLIETPEEKEEKAITETNINEEEKNKINKILEFCATRNDFSIDRFKIFKSELSIEDIRKYEAIQDSKDNILTDICTPTSTVDILLNKKYCTDITNEFLK